MSEEIEEIEEILSKKLKKSANGSHDMFQVVLKKTGDNIVCLLSMIAFWICEKVLRRF